MRVRERERVREEESTRVLLGFPTCAQETHNYEDLGQE